jgi:hypothetical protein
MARKNRLYLCYFIKIRKTFAFTKDIEGWGMTNDGKYLPIRTEQKNLDNKP